MLTEALATAAFCAAIGGIEEVRHNYPHSYVKVDCETEELVIEAGLDKRSSLDSIQQAVFFSTLTGKTPVVVIYDTDGKIGKYEYRIQQVAITLNVDYLIINIDTWKPLAGTGM